MPRVRAFKGVRQLAKVVEKNGKDMQDNPEYSAFLSARENAAEGTFLYHYNIFLNQVGNKDEAQKAKKENDALIGMEKTAEESQEPEVCFTQYEKIYWALKFRDRNPAFLNVRERCQKIRERMLFWAEKISDKTWKDIVKNLPLPTGHEPRGNEPGYKHPKIVAGWQEKSEAIRGQRAYELKEFEKTYIDRAKFTMAQRAIYDELQKADLLTRYIVVLNLGLSWAYGRQSFENIANSLGFGKKKVAAIARKFFDDKFRHGTETSDLLG